MSLEPRETVVRYLKTLSYDELVAYCTGMCAVRGTFDDTVVADLLKKAGVEDASTEVPEYLPLRHHDEHGNRLCRYRKCQKPFPPGTPHQRRYCDDTCRDSANRKEVA